MSVTSLAARTAPGPSARRRAVGQAALLAGALLLSAAYVYAGVAAGSRVHLWMDEVLAVSAAREPTLPLLLRDIWAGTDFSPPTYHVLLHAISRLAGGQGGVLDGTLIWRVPSLLAVFAAGLCVHATLRPALSRPAALLGFGLVLSLGLFDFAVQARPYALLAFAFAAALLLWTRVDGARRPLAVAAGLWLSLAACLGLHFYGAVEVGVIGLAELIYLATRRRVRPAVWAALVLTIPAALALAPLATHLSTINAADALAPGYYGKPTLGRFMSAVLEVVGGGRPGLLLLLAAALVLGTARLWGRRAAPAGQPAPPGRAMTPIEIAIIALCALPVATFLLSFLVTKSFSLRYMSAAALLPALALPWAVDRLPARNALVAVLVPLMALQLLHRSRGPDPLADTLAVLAQPGPTLPPGLPIVVGEGLRYIELMYAAPPETRARLVYLKAPPGTVSPDPTNENEAVRMAALHPDYRVLDQAPFLAANPRFLVLAVVDATTDLTTASLVGRGLIDGVAAIRSNVVLLRGTSP